MTRIIICMYSKNINEFIPLCTDHERMVCVPIYDDTYLDEYAERIKSLSGSDRSVLLTDEWGGSPFLGALIAAGRTGSIVITDVDVPLCRKIISFLNEGKDPEGLSELVSSDRFIDASKMKGDIAS